MEVSRQCMRVPELSRKASEYIAAIEDGSPESPVSLDMLVEGGDIMSTLEMRMGEIDTLYDRHEELFFKNNHITPRDELDYEAVFILSQDVLRKVYDHDQVFRTAALGLAVLQFAEAGSRAAHDPSLLIASSYDGQNISKAIVDRAGGLGKESFEVFQDRLQGDIHSLPRVRLGYLGCLMCTHYDFWSGVVSAKMANTPSAHEKAINLLSLFPAKGAAWDTHSSYGRPSPGMIRNDLYIKPMKEFEKTLVVGGATGWDPRGNITDAMPFLFGAIDLATAQGNSLNKSLQIAAYNSSTVGRLTERRLEGLPIDTWDENWMAKITEGTLRFEGDREWPRLTIDEARLATKDLSPEQLHKRQTRSQKAGTCVARNPVSLKRNGATHQNVLTLSNAMSERIGVKPPVLQEVGDDIYVDPAALTACYTLFAIAANYDGRQKPHSG